MPRGDRFWADGNYAAALAEYRLAARQDGGAPATLARVAHAYVMTGQLERAREEYANLLKSDPDFVDQAVFDYLTVAYQARDQADRYTMARAAEAALELRPGLQLPGMAAELARYFASTGESERALEYFERALARNPGEAAGLLWEIAGLRERQGGCAAALPYFRDYVALEPYGDSADQARFRIGACGLELGRRYREAGNYDLALEHLRRVTEAGYPPNLQDQAWFERGEASYAAGFRDEAIDSFRRVVELTAGRSSQIGTRAARRIQELQTAGTTSR